VGECGGGVREPRLGALQAHLSGEDQVTGGQILVAKSGIGKDSTHDGIPMLLELASVPMAERFVRAQDFVSGEALHKEELREPGWRCASWGWWCATTSLWAGKRLEQGDQRHHEERKPDPKPDLRCRHCDDHPHHHEGENDAQTLQKCLHPQILSPSLPSGSTLARECRGNPPQTRAFVSMCRLIWATIGHVRGRTGVLLVYWRAGQPLPRNSAPR
jgi:hypothetical protein